MVAFNEVDATDVVWHGNYYRYFEQARDALLRKIEYDYPVMQRGHYVWPVIDTRVRYLRPARYGQTIDAWAGLTEWRYHMRMEYEVRDAGNNQLLTTGYTVQCPVLRADGKAQTRSPDEFLVHLAPYLP